MKRHPRKLKKLLKYWSKIMYTARRERKVVVGKFPNLAVISADKLKQQKPINLDEAAKFQDLSAIEKKFLQGRKTN